MRTALISLLFTLAILPASAGSKCEPAAPDYDLREGDIVFQGNAGAQAEAVRAATGSLYTHCGVVFENEGRLFVIEAVQPVRATPLKTWIQRSQPGTYRAYRLKRALAPDAVAKARTWATRQIGKDYDLKFGWDDDTLYCSELVWKLYRQAGVELCERRPFRDYDLAAPSVKAIIDQRYGGMDQLPLDEPAVAPGDLAASDQLVEAPRLAAKKKR